MNYGRFTETHILRNIGRELLTEFFDRFGIELEAKGTQLPDIHCSDDAYFEGWSQLLMTPEALPDRMHDVLHEIHELASPEGHERLTAALKETCPELEINIDGTREETALRAWLHAPAVVARKYNEQWLGRLSRFDYYETRANPFSWGDQSAGSCGNNAVLVQRLDEWCVANGRGDETVVIEKYELNGEEWYLIRHGDTFIRSAKVEKRKLEVLHYRPAKDDVVVYSPARDELRINAKSKGEKELYRETFGYFLKGYQDCFEETLTYTLEPLRELGAAALECDEVAGMKRVVLTKLEIDLANARGQSYTLRADDLYACIWQGEQKGPVIPAGAKLLRAGFEIHVEGMDKPLELQVKPPNTLRLARHAAAPLAHDWMTAKGFKRSGTKTESERTTHEILVAQP